MFVKLITVSTRVLRQRGRRMKHFKEKRPLSSKAENISSVKFDSSAEK